MFGKSLTAKWPAGAQIAAASVVAIGGLSLTTSGVWAALQASANNTGLNAATGDLILTATGPGVALTTAITNMAPNDVVYRYVNIENTGSLSGKDLNFSAALTQNGVLAGPEPLNSATRGLKLRVQQCVGGTWTLTDITDIGVCTGGTISTVVGENFVSTMGTPGAYTLPATVPTATPLRFRVKILLPDQDELRVNGGAATLPNGSALPDSGVSVQGKSAILTYTFTETQRTETTTSS